MNKKLITILSAFSLCVVMTACSKESNDSSNNTNSVQSITSPSIKSETIGDIDTYIKLEDNNTTVEGNGVEIKDNIITINQSATYSISGNLSDGQLIVNTNKEEKTYILLDGVNISCKNTSPIYVTSSEKTIIALAENSKNYISDGSNYAFENTSEDEPNAAIFSKEDLTFIGNGYLEVKGNYDRGIVSKDDLVIQSGDIKVTSVGDGLRGKDSVVLMDGNITIDAGGDGIQSNNSEDSTKGYVYIDKANLDITSEQDGIQGETNVLVNSGNIKITSGGGSENSSSKNDGWGNWGMVPPNSHNDSTSTEETTSAKAIKAGSNITINNGSIDINSSDDSIHSNDTLIINEGKINLSSGDDGIHSDSQLDINGGTINITKSYEGIESQAININDGDIHLVASDDGINAGGGNDGSSAEGRPGANNFSSSLDCEINISSGYIYLNADGDGLDANGSINMSGGTVIVNGPTDGGNGALDYDGNFDVTGGTLIASGSLGMVQTPSSSSSQNTINISLSSKEANSLIHIEDEDGNDVLTFAPAKSYQSVVVCTSNIKSNNTYKVYSGGSYSGSQKDGLYSNGSYSGGSQIGSSKISSSITNISESGISSFGNMGQPGGNQDRGPGQRR